MFLLSSGKMKYLILIVLASLLLDICCCQKINGHLRVATFYNPLGNIPNVTVNKVGAIENKLLQWISKYLNFTYEICVPTDVLQLGSPDEVKRNGSWTGVLGLLLRDEADMTISFGPQMHSRYMVTDATVNIILDEISMMVPYPLQATDATDLMDIFSFSTWFLIFGSTCMVMIALWSVAHIQQWGERDGGVISIFIIAVALSQGGFLRQYSLASRSIHGAWLLSLVVLSYAYTGTLTSMITSPKYQFFVNSIEEIATKENVQPLIIKESSTHSEFEESELPVFQTIFKRVTESSKLLIPSTITSDYVEVLLSEPNQVFIISNLLADSEIERDFKKFGICRATLLPRGVKDRRNSMFLQKKSPYTPALNKQFLLLRQSGLTDYLDKTLDSVASRCYINERNLKSGPREHRPFIPLTTYQLRGVFILLGYFLLICCLVFLCELLYAECHRNSY